MCQVLEVFDAARYAQHILLSLSPYYSDKEFGNVFWFGTSAGGKVDEPEVK